METYLEEEIRSEALVRNLAHFNRFLYLSAVESGNLLNFSKISQDIGVTHNTISAYYQILEDCLIAKRIEPITASSTRKQLTKSPKILFLGFRFAIAFRDSFYCVRRCIDGFSPRFVSLKCSPALVYT